MPFEIGNKAAAKGRRFEQMLERAIKGDDAVRLRRACEALLDKAADGDLNAIGMIRDTLDGKPKQQVEMKADNSLTVILAQSLPDGTILNPQLNQPLSTDSLIIDGQAGEVGGG